MPLPPLKARSTKVLQDDARTLKQAEDIFVDVMAPMSEESRQALARFR